VSFRQHVLDGAPVLGTFVKTASHQTVEVLGRSNLDFTILDAEHAPIGIESVDRMIGAARGVDLPALVRVPDATPSFIAACLDSGATGVLVPHVRNAASATACVAAVKFDRGQRGFSPSPRAGSYGTQDPRRYLDAADAGSTLWCQIEDAEALDNLDEIAAVPDVDCLFIGRADLALSLGVPSIRDAAIGDAVRKTCEAGARHNVRIGIFVGRPEEIPELQRLGITVFVCSSDQSLLIDAARRARDIGFGGHHAS
jgi:2-keto-3-deoxy-L-rhamnonate aldolase RhmA